MEILQQRIVSIVVSRQVILGGGSIEPTLQRSGVKDTEDLYFDRCTAYTVIQGYSFNSRYICTELVSLDVTLNTKGNLNCQVLTRIIITVVEIIRQRVLRRNVRRLAMSFTTLGRHVRRVTTRHLIIKRRILIRSNRDHTIRRRKKRMPRRNTLSIITRRRNLPINRLRRHKMKYLLLSSHTHLSRTRHTTRGCQGRHIHTTIHLSSFLIRLLGTSIFTLTLVLRNNPIAVNR